MFLTLLITSALLQQAIAIGVEPAPSCKLSHEVYKTCGSACPRTCDNYKKDIICTMQCVAGCYCEADYVRDSSGNCVLTSECTSQVPLCTLSHEVYKSCGTACPRTCENYKNPPSACTKQCVAGCFCESPYVRDNNGCCVKETQCKSKV